MALHVLVFNSQPPWRRQVEMKDICSDEERYCRDFWNPKGDLLGFFVCWASRVNFLVFTLESSHRSWGRICAGRKLPGHFRICLLSTLASLGLAQQMMEELSLRIFGCTVAGAMSPAIFQRKNRENQTGMFGTIATQYIETIWFWTCNKGEVENDSGQLCMLIKSAGCVWLHEETVKTAQSDTK